MVRTLHSLLSPQDALPDEVLAELVGMMYTSTLPVIVMGLTAACIGGLITQTSGGLLLPVLIVLCLVETAARVWTVHTYRARVRGLPLSAAEVRQWELRYAYGSYGFALLLGLLNARALMSFDGHVAMLATGMLFGYGAGLVARMSVRPVICIGSLMLAVVPTVAGLCTHFASGGVHRSTYVAQALLLLVFALAGLETIYQNFQMTLGQLLTKRDLAQMVRRDELTGMPNRLSLRDRFNEDVARMERSGDLIAVHALDLDRFKAVNDGFGHPTGDALLQAVAGRLRNTLQAGDMATRLGGDEFVVLQTGIAHPEEASVLAERILQVLSMPYVLDGHEVAIGVSVGIALRPRDGMTLEALLACADAALYAAKREGRNRVVFWTKRPAQVDGLAVSA